MRRLVAVTVGVALVAGCTPSRPVKGTGTVSPVATVSPLTTTSTVAATTTVTTPATATSVPDVPVDTVAFEVESLGLTFGLPEEFRFYEDPDLLFSARSMRRRSLITIAADSAQVTDYDRRPGETILEPDLGVDAALIVTNSAIEGLPADLSANALLVSNGERSFSVIMSGPTTDLPELWAVFIDSFSVSVTPNA
jgi:hypothetical protein